MTTETPPLDRLCEALALQGSQIADGLLSGYLPDGAAVEVRAEDAGVQLSRRIATAPGSPDTPTAPIERMLDWLNARTERGCWQLRRRRRPAAIEVWLSAKRRCDGPDRVAPAAAASRDLAAAARRHRAAVAALCQPRVAAILSEYSQR